MILENLIPNNDHNWLIRSNMIYYHHYCDIPLLQKRDNKIWIILDLKVTKQVLRLCKHLIKSDVPFYFNAPALNHKQDLLTDESKAEIIRSYLFAMNDDTFFDNITKTGLDYTENLTKYMIEYECMNIFKSVYDPFKKSFLSKYHDWYKNDDIFNVKREDKRDFIDGLERQIKLNLFL